MIVFVGFWCWLRWLVLVNSVDWLLISVLMVVVIALAVGYCCDFFVGDWLRVCLFVLIVCVGCCLAVVFFCLYL